MKISQDTSDVDKCVGREPLWRNWRFDAGDHTTTYQDGFFEKKGLYRLEHIVVGHSRRIRTRLHNGKRG